MGPGRVVTEHDVHAGAWYLDGGRIPTCIAVESGQADLFLSAWLGIDFVTRGLAVYRLLDAEITFHDALPGPGKVIRYDIHIDHFFRQGETRLFRFNFEGTVNGRPLLTMKNGCAGFFTRAELDAGRGIVRTALESRPQAGGLPADWQELAPMQRESYADSQVQALRDGRLDGCFGPLFRDLPLQRPARFGTRNVLTEEEFEERARAAVAEEESLLAEIDVFTADVTTPCAIRCPTSPTPHWQETGKPSRQASLIIDPPDGRQPPLSAEGQARQAQQQAEARARRERLQGREADSHLDRSLYDRCITRGVLGSILPVIYNNGNEIVQAPGYVVLRNEMITWFRDLARPFNTFAVTITGVPHAIDSAVTYPNGSGQTEGTMVAEAPE